MLFVRSKTYFSEQIAYSSETNILFVQKHPNSSKQITSPSEQIAYLSKQILIRPDKKLVRPKNS